MEVSIKVIADNEEGQSNHVGEADLLEEPNAAINEPDWCSHEVINFPTKMNQSVCCSSNCMDLTRLVIFTRGGCKLELLLNSHGCNNFLSHATSGQVIVPVVASHKHHSNIETHKKKDQSNRIIEI